MFRAIVPKRESGISSLGAMLAVALVLLILVAAFLVQENYRHRALKFETPYQAMLLTNGNVYFGQLEGYGTRFSVLKDVFYVQTSTNPETKQSVNVLIKRGKELHAPDRMYLTPNQIPLVEPVGPGSKVAQLIAEQKKQL